MTELVVALKEHLGMSDDDARELFSRLDLTRDGHINYSMFLAAAAQRRFLGQEKLFRVAFDRFDVDHSGVISPENLKEVLGHSYMGLKPEDIIHQIKQEGDGVIRYEDFLKAMMDLGCEDSWLPGSAEGVKNISRAFSLISPKAGRSSPPSFFPKRGARCLNRGWRTPDAEDAVQEQVDEGDDPINSVPVGWFRVKSSSEAESTQARESSDSTCSEEQLSYAAFRQLRAERMHNSDKE